MTVTVYIWRAQGTQVGHASMELEDETCVSLWPGEGKAGKKKKKGKGKEKEKKGKEKEKRERNRLFIPVRIYKKTSTQKVDTLTMSFK